MFKNLKIGVRLGLGFGLVTLLLIAISILGLTRISALSSEIDDMVKDKFPKTIQANDIIDQVNVAARATRNALLTNKPEVAKAELDRISGVSKTISDRIEQLEKTVTSPEGRKILEAIQDTRKAYVSELGKFIEFINTGKREEAVATMFGDLRKTQGSVRESCGVAHLMSLK